MPDNSNCAETDCNNNNNDDALKWKEDFTKVGKDQLVRGHTPAGIEERCLALVQSYIGGSWCNASSTEDISVKRIAGGFTNQMYHVQLKDSVPRSPNPIYGTEEPVEVAIKLYQAKHIKNYNPADPERLNDTIILNVMSQTGLGPKVYGMFEDGFIQAFHEHEQLRAKHHEDPTLRRQLMKLLASIAHLQVPIRKDANLLLDQAGKYIVDGYEKFGVQALAEELNLKHLKSTDVLAEHRELMGRIAQLQAPLVFCHNDFRGSNLLVTGNEETKHRSILAVDLEHAGYGTRGYDLACVFLESAQNDFLDFGGPPPTDETLQSYVRLYVDACEQVAPGYGAREENSFEQHMKEARLMVLFNMLFFVAFLFGQRESLLASVPLDRKKNLAFAEAILADYLQTKESYIEKGFY